MRNKISLILLASIALPLLVGCSTRWTEAIQSGEVTKNQFHETIKIEIRNGLVFVPVTINNKEHLFLFDTGAPFSISTKLQNEYNFKVVSKGNIVDSDNNRKKVEWSQVDTTLIGNVAFLNQTAFIGDFEANPILGCLEIDGIIGSNLMRHCNWTIDQQSKSLTLFKDIRGSDSQSHFTIPFKTDHQYNIFTNVNVGQAVVKNVLVDYGSISLDDEIFATLKSRGIISKTFHEKGMKQSGIVGETISLDREITSSDSVRLDSAYLKNVMLRTGKTTSIGNGFLSRFELTIDWDNRKLHFFDVGETYNAIQLAGFKLGYSADLGVYVQSVLVNSNAYHEGVRPHMKVVKVDKLDFTRGNTFCDYANHELGETIFLELIDTTGNKREFRFERTTL